MYGYLPLQITLCASVLLFSMQDAIAKTSQRSQRLIVSLDVPADQAPEYLCIVSESRSCPEGSEDSNGNLIREADCATREFSDLQDIGSLPADLSNGDVSIAAPEKQIVVRHYKNSSETVRLDPDLLGALQSVSRRKSAMCDEMHEGCAPRVRLTAFEKSGRIVCGRDGSVTPSAHNGRVAIVALSYHEGESRSGVQRVELHGTSATLSLQQELAASNFAFAQVIGGDYAFSAITSIGTNERIVVALHPRCTLFGAELPRLSLSAPLVKANISLDVWGTSPEPMSIATCTPNVRRTALPINIPYIEGTGTKRLVVNTGHDRDLVLETTWNGALPPSPLGWAYRRFEFVWRRDCLSGEWPASERSSHDASWGARCPRATVEGLPRCIVVDQPNKSICRYSCEIADSVPALPLPANVQFDRVRAQGAQDQIVYSWQDTVLFAGQELRSFVASADRAIALEFADPTSWQDRAGDTLDGVRVTAPGGSIENVDLTSQGGHEMLPSWTSVSTPNISCSSRLRVTISGASSYGERSVAVAGGRVVLDDPHSFRPRWHPRLLIGGGTLGVPSERTSASLFVPRHSTPYASIGGLAEMYIDYLPAAIEYRALLDITKSTFFEECTNNRCIQTDSRHGRAWYTRSNLGASFLWWVSRRLHVGAGLALSVGLPLFQEDEDKVGSFRLSFVTELIDVQARLGGNAWLDVAVGVRWGEEHNYFKSMDFLSKSGSRDVADSVRYNSPFITTRIRL